MTSFNLATRGSAIGRTLIRTVALSAVVACGFAFAPHAQASQVTYQLNTYLGTQSGTPTTLTSGAYVTVQLTSDGNNVDVTVTPATSPYQVGFVNTGAGDALLWDLNGISPLSISNVTSGFELVSATSGNIHADGSGYWDYAISCSYSGGACSGSGGSNPDTNAFSFTVDGVSLSDFIANANNNFFASDVCIEVVNGSCQPGYYTGVVIPGGTPTTNVPEPGTLALFAAGLLGCGLFLRRRARQS